MLKSAGEAEKEREGEVRRREPTRPRGRARNEGESPFPGEIQARLLRVRRDADLHATLNMWHGGPARLWTGREVRVRGCQTPRRHVNGHAVRPAEDCTEVPNVRMSLPTTVRIREHMPKKLLARLSNAIKRRAGDNLRIVAAHEHGIDLSDVSPSAQSVVETLVKGGYEAYIVGGGVRDLMLDLHPKDFDIATDAHPEQVRKLFDHCCIIGRRFRLVHVWTGRSRAERDRIEVATFRGGHRSRSGRAHVSMTLGGRILRDNAYGTIDQDAERRDFTVNALFYDPVRNVVLDFVGGVGDLKHRYLHMIGKPVVRFREDPVRLLRAVRFAAKLDFQMDPAMEQLIPELAELLGAISPARLFDESVKLLHSGGAERTFDMLRQKKLLSQLFPRTEAALERARPGDMDFIRRALANTDKRVREGLPVSASFAYAVVMWPYVRQLLNELDPGEFSPRDALTICAKRALEHQTRTTSIPMRHAQAIREIWIQQPQLEAGPHSHPERVMSRNFFRATYDFLGLRASQDAHLKKSFEEWTQAQEKYSPGSGGAPRRRRRRRR